MEHMRGMCPRGAHATESEVEQHNVSWAECREVRLLHKRPSNT